MAQVAVEYQWERAEYLRVMRRGAMPLAFRKQYLLGVFVIACGVLLEIGRSSGIALFLYIFGVVYGAYWFWIMRFATAKAWSKAVGIKGQMKIEVTDDGVSAKSDIGESKLTWAVFPHSREWSEYYFLMKNKRFVATIIPKRAFLSRADEAAFRNLLRAHTSPKLVSNDSLDGSLGIPSATS